MTSKYAALRKIIGNCFEVLSDQARNYRKDARRSLAGDLLKHLGTHLFLWLLYPNPPETRKKWEIEIQAALANVLEDVTRESHEGKDGRRIATKLWLGAKEIQKALNGKTASCDMGASRKMGVSPQIKIEDVDSLHYFSDYGFQISEKKDDRGINLILTYKGEVIADTSTGA